MEQLPKSGIALAVENSAQATAAVKGFTNSILAQVAATRQLSGASDKQVASVNKMVSNLRASVKPTKDAAGATQHLSSVNKALTGDLSRLGQNFLQQIPLASKFGGTLSSLFGAGSAAASGTAAATAGTATLAAGMSAAVIATGGLIIAIGAAIVAFAVFWKIGKRGAELQNTIEAFKNVTSGVSNSTAVLEGLRKATRGTISDMELMRLTTSALQGQSDEFRNVLLQTENGMTNLGKVLDVTTRAARATGQSEEYIRDKFLNGLRLQSKLRLDDIGVTIKAEEANKKYAESIGKTAAALTDAEKKQAFLTEAISQLDRIGAEAPINRIQDALSRMGAAFQNFKDKFTLLLQPIFAPIAEVISALVTAIFNGMSMLLNLLKPVVDVIGAIMNEVKATVGALGSELFGGIAGGMGNTLNYIIAAAQLIGQALVGIIKLAGSLIRQAIQIFFHAIRSIGNPIRELFGAINDDTNTDINTMAFNLGKGGGAIIGAFAVGILKAGTYVAQAVTAIAKIVADFLMGSSPPKKGILKNIDRGGANVAMAWADGFLGGVVQSFGQVTEYVNDRLGSIANMSRDQLQAGLAGLDLALRPFRENLAIVKADMEAIAGFTDPAMKILERQRTALLKAFGKGEGADIERLRTQDRQIEQLKTLKEFQQDQVDKAELQLALASAQQAQQRALYGIALDRLGAEKQITSATVATGDAAEEKAKSGGGGAPSEAGGAGGGLGLGGGTAPDLFSSEGIDRARQQILATLAGVASSGAAGISAGLAESGVGGALAGLQSQGGALANQVNRIKGADPAAAIAKKFQGLKDQLTAPLTDAKNFIEEQFNALFGEEGTVMIALNNFSSRITGIFTGEGNAFGTAQTAITNLVTTAQEQFPLLSQALTDALAPMTETFNGFFIGEESPLFLAQQALTTAVDDMKAKFIELKDEIFFRLQDAAIHLRALFIDPGGAIEIAKTAVTNLLNHIINNFLRLTNTGANTLSEALSPLGSILTNVLKAPFKNAVEAIANFFVNALNAVIDSYNNLPLGGALEVPSLTPILIPPMAKGTLGYNRPFIAGERGAELITPARNNPLSVFPNKATMALQRLATMPISRPAAMPTYSYPTQNNSSTSVNGSYNSSKNLTVNARQNMTRLEMIQLLAGM